MTRLQIQQEYFQSEKWTKFQIAKAICDVMLRGYTGYKGKESAEDE